MILKFIPVIETPTPPFDMQNTKQQQAIYPSQLMVDLDLGGEIEGEDEKKIDPPSHTTAGGVDPPSHTIAGSQ
jgi:hypothetical protein